MTALSVSVVIVSRHRPDELRKCLRALKFQTLCMFDVVIVGDAGIPAVLDALGLRNSVTFSQFDQPNISKARNIGVGLASGQIVAFIDDDAIAEPTWLERLTAPFANQEVAAAGGFVRGRNGISFQWKAMTIDAAGDSEPIDVSETVILKGTKSRAIKTQGTNCAFRRDTVIELGGFDENFHFYLDEADLNLRLARSGYSTAIVPNAEVQHGFAKSARRTRHRAPRSLFNEGASQSYLLKKYGQDLTDLDGFKANQKGRLLRHMVVGEFEPQDIGRLLDTLDSGFREGQKREPITPDFLENKGVGLRFPAHDPEPHRCLFGYWQKRDGLFREAKALAAAGTGVTVFTLSYSTLFHRRWFHEDGFWVQSGGLFGKSNRSDPIFKYYRMRDRVEREFEKLQNSRIFHSKPQHY